MAIQKINLDAPHPELDALVDLIEAGDEVVLLRDDKEVARLVSVTDKVKQTQKRRVPDLFPGIWISDDFDEPLLS
ncbi:MAG: type II toxin-antitoxin system prevent-host-death family antitoxin [Chloroflexi bacterium]|nr:type II toxin-antitoxin system prevent-host-death family antitoxin [Chloroflexota bacterium]